MSGNVPSITSPPWSLATKRIVALVVVLFGFLFLRQVNGVTWNAIVVTLVLAYLLSPVVTFFERRLSFIGNYELRRALGVLLSWVFVLGLFGLVLGLVIPATIRQLREFGDRLPDLVESTQDDLEKALSKPITIGDYTFVPWDQLNEAFTTEKDDETDLTSTLQDTVLSLADPALGVVGGALSFIVTLSFVLVMLFYLMRDGPLFVEYVENAVPESYRGDVQRLLHELGLIWNAYLRGQVTLCLSIGVATYVAALILGLPQPLLLALVAGFLEFIPNLGPTLAQIPALLFALTTPSSTLGLDAGVPFAVVVSLTYILIQNLEAVFLVPRILGGSLDLHPFVVLVAVLIGTNLAGILGIVLAAPMVATARLFGRYLRGKLLDEDVFPVASYATQRRRFVFRVLHFLLSKRFPVLPDSEGRESDPAVGGRGW